MKSQNHNSTRLVSRFCSILILIAPPTAQAKLTTADQTILETSIQKTKARLDTRINVSVHDTNNRKTIQYINASRLQAPFKRWPARPYERA